MFYRVVSLKVVVIETLMVIMFFGGWSGLGWAGGWGRIGFRFKVYLVVWVIVRVRGTFPRLRIDQLMAIAWKVMGPRAFLSVGMTAVYQVDEWPAWTLTIMSSAGLLVVGYVIYKRSTGPSRLVAEVRTRQEALEARRRATTQAEAD